MPTVAPRLFRTGVAPVAVRRGGPSVICSGELVDTKLVDAVADSMLICTALLETPAGCDVLIVLADIEPVFDGRDEESAGGR